MTSAKGVTQVRPVYSDTAVAEAGELLLEHKFRCLPVVHGDDRLEGMITVTVRLRAYVAHHEAANPAF